MRALRAFLFRLGGLFHRERREREMALEFESHLEMEIEASLRRGMTPEEARRAALVKSGGLETAKEAWRDRSGLPVVETAIRDLRFALRQLRRNPGFAAVVVLTLALGIGMNTAVFTVVNALLLRPLPYPRADRLVQLGEYDKKRDQGLQTVSYPNFADWKRASKVFERMAAWHVVDLGIVGPVQPEQIAAAATSPEFFETMGVHPELGSTLAANQDAPSAVISHELFVRQFGADPSAIGKSLRVGQAAFRVAGVAPRGFHFPPGADFWFLERYWNPATLADREAHNFQVVGRLKPDATLEQARVEMGAIARRLEEAYPKSNRDQGVRLVSLHERTVGGVRRTLWVLMAAAGLLLLIGCANVANLLLSRSATRRQEIAVRASIGASRTRIACQLVTEGAVLATLGGAAGLAAAFWGVKALLASAPESLPSLDAMRMDGTVFAFVVLVSLLTIVLFGLAPAWQLSRTGLSEALGGAGRGAGEAAGRARVRSAFVVVQFAMATVLLTGAGLLVKSLLKLQDVNLGFRSDRLLTVQLRGPYFRQGGPGAWSGFLEEVIDRIEELPGVEAAGAATELPVEGVSWATRFSKPGVSYASEAARPAADYRIVSPGYFSAMGIPLQRGRFLSERDTKDAPAVVVINQTLARRYFAGEDPIGRQVALDIFGKAPREIVGIVGDVRQGSLDVEPEPEVYESLLQRPFPATVVVRTRTEPLSMAAAVRGAIWAVDREQPIGRVASMDEIIAKSLGMPRFRSALLLLFAAIGGALAMIGVYGVLSYSVARRTHELGIRAALGAGTGRTLSLILGQGLRLAVAGIVAGIAAAFAVSRLLSSLLYGTRATDPAVFVGTAVLLALTAIPACLIPAFRAAGVDPITALRNE
jgi:predicted permease